MVKTANSNSSSPVSTDEAQKKRKKQAKREAKAMLVVEKAKVGVEKAEQKLAKAQTRVEARTARLRMIRRNNQMSLLRPIKKHPRRHRRNRQRFLPLRLKLKAPFLHRKRRSKGKALMTGKHQIGLCFHRRAHHRSQCSTDSNGLRAAGLKSVPSAYATGMSAACITFS